MNKRRKYQVVEPPPLNLQELEGGYDVDWWDTLPDHIKAAVERSLEQAERGELIPHEEVMKKYKKWLKK